MARSARVGTLLSRMAGSRSTERPEALSQLRRELDSLETEPPTLGLLQCGDEVRITLLERVGATLPVARDAHRADGGALTGRRRRRRRHRRSLSALDLLRALLKTKTSTAGPPRPSTPSASRRGRSAPSLSTRRRERAAGRNRRVNASYVGRSNRNEEVAHMRSALLAAAAVTALAVAGCGSSSTTTSSSTPAAVSTAATSTAAPTSSTPASSGAGKLAVAADPSGALKFNTSSLSAKAGKVTIAFTNQSSVGHNLTVATASGSVLGATPTFTGGTKTLTVTLKAGNYMYYCAVPGHKMAGMMGTLVVT